MFPKQNEVLLERKVENRSPTLQVISSSPWTKLHFARIQKWESGILPSGWHFVIKIWWVRITNFSVKLSWAAQHEELLSDSQVSANLRKSIMDWLWVGQGRYIDFFPPFCIYNNKGHILRASFIYGSFWGKQTNKSTHCSITPSLR